MLALLKDKRVLAAIGGIVFVVVVAIAINAYMNYKDKQNQRHEQQQVESGVIKERAEQQGEVLNRVEQSQAIERNPDPVITNIVRCKYDRNAPAHCK